MAHFINDDSLLIPTFLSLLSLVWLPASPPPPPPPPPRKHMDRTTMDNTIVLSLSLSLLTAECRSQKAGCEHGPISPPPLFHPRLRAVNKPRQSAIPRADCERANSTNVRQQEHDGGMWSATWEVSHSGRHVPWEDVNEGNRSANAERSE